MRFIQKARWVFVFLMSLCIVTPIETAEAQPRHPVVARRNRQSRRSFRRRQSVRSARGRRVSVPRVPRYLTRLRGHGHRGWQGVGEDYLPQVLAAYNEMTGRGRRALWMTHLARCAAHHRIFAEVGRFFQIPTAFVAAFPLHESHCVQTARDWAGGHGIMQLTYVSRRMHVQPLERMLRRRLHWQTDNRDGVYIGMMHWVVPERILRVRFRRGFGILGYNMDPRTIRRYLRAFHRDTGVRRHPTFAEYAERTLPCIHGRHGRCPRNYVARVLAAAYAYERFLTHLPLVPINALSARDVPGFDPRYDRTFFSEQALPSPHR